VSIKKSPRLSMAHGRHLNRCFFPSLLMAPPTWLSSREDRYMSHWCAVAWQENTVWEKRSGFWTLISEQSLPVRLARASQYSLDLVANGSPLFETLKASLCTEMNPHLHCDLVLVYFSCLSVLQSNLVSLFPLYFFFWDRVSLYNPGYPQTCNPPALASGVLRFQACTTVPGCLLGFFI
jgi:hypothetical protein